MKKKSDNPRGKTKGRVLKQKGLGEPDGSGLSMMDDSRPIGIFDSGVGGLTVVHEVFRRLPNEAVVYFGDTARVPYGTKSPHAVKRYAAQDVAFLLEHDVKMIVVACHTASAMALDYLTEQVDLPVIGVTEPGVRAAILATRNQRIGVIGTRGTVLSGTYERALAACSSGARVLSRSCPLFVPLAEEGWLDGPVSHAIAREYLDALKRESIDTLILGCTHYPLLKPVISAIMGDRVTLIDSAEETAASVFSYLEQNQMFRNIKERPVHQFFVSDIPDQFQEVGERFLGMALDLVKQVDIESYELRGTIKKMVANITE